MTARRWSQVVRQLVAAAVLGVCLAAAGTAPLHADEAASLLALKESGQVGETMSGYVEPVDSELEPAAQATLERINAERRAAYAKIAADRGVTLDQVAALAGAKLIDAAPSGQLVRDSTGEWKRK